MSAIEQVFSELRQAKQKALMPFVTAGDPDLDFTAEVIRELDRRGCHLLELGFPYSDPIADGPVIQASYTRALDAQIKVGEILAMAKEVIPQIKMPVVAMVSFTIVHRRGMEAFIDSLREAGISGAIVPDLPVDESAELAGICEAQDFSLIQLITPTTPRERAARILKQCSGFVYYVSVTGITGEREAVAAGLTEKVNWLREQTDLPVCIGFGISKPEHVELLKGSADGLIVGSAFVRRIAQASELPRQQVLTEVGEFAESLLAALRK